MRISIRVLLLAALTVGAAGVSASLAADGLEHKVSVRELMVSTITPATNTLWGADNPQTEDAWRVLEEAAVTVIAAGTLIKDGGTGANDRSWADDPDWQSFADTMIAAGVDARDAILANDIDALMTATEVMYPPCEECHLQFHPEMQ